MLNYVLMFIELFLNVYVMSDGCLFQRYNSLDLFKAIIHVKLFTQRFATLIWRVSRWEFFFNPSCGISGFIMSIRLLLNVIECFFDYYWIIVGSLLDFLWMCICFLLNYCWMCVSVYWILVKFVCIWKVHTNCCQDRNWLAHLIMVINYIIYPLSISRCTTAVFLIHDYHEANDMDSPDDNV